jgi:glycosyltransferase involved in cell wall biosynthesis
MRILMLAQWYSPVLGGEERHVEGLAHALADRGHEVSVATLAHQGKAADTIEDGVRIHRIDAAVQRASWLFSNNDRQSVPPFPDPALTVGLRRLIRRGRPDVIHAHNWMVHSYLPLHRRSSPPLVLTLHDYSLVCAKKNLMYRGRWCDGPAPAKCLRCASGHYGVPKAAVTVGGLGLTLPRERRAVDRFIAVSHVVAKGNHLDTDELPYDVIPNFIPDRDPAADPRTTAMLAELPREPFILYVGGLAPIKGVDVLLRAYRRLHEPPPLALIGYTTGEKVPGLEDVDSRVTIHTDWPHAAVLEAWQRSLFGVVPSVWAEPFGIVAIEAMAAGRALVASRTGGLLDIVDDGETGLFSEPGDPADLARALQRLIDEPELRDRMGRSALGRVERFRQGSVVPQIEAVYARVASDRRLPQKERAIRGPISRVTDRAGSRSDTGR